jgi:dipeptidase D
MSINELKSQNKLLEIFCELAVIPSPSLREEKVIEWILDFTSKNNIACEADAYRNLVIKVPATNSQKQSILLSAHMDVVGDFSPIKLEVNGDFIQTDNTRTLGADNKAGVACALLLALELTDGGDVDHGGLEIIFTRDEEHGMSGIKHVDFKSIQSKYALVLDADKLGQLLVSGASYTNGLLKVETTYGGHSGLDIQDKNRLNAAKLIADLASKIPQGVFFSDETGTITSINLGTIIGGNIQNTVSKILVDHLILSDYMDYFMENAVTNVINTSAQASYSIRSASVEKENELKQIINGEIDKFNQQYKELAKAEIVFSQHLPPFEKAQDDIIQKLHTAACKKLEIKQNISSFHAGAETHIYAKNKNAKGETICPFLVGMADIFNMHSKDEKIDYKTFLQGYDLLKEIFKAFNG